MAVPALRIPLGLDTQSFEKSISEAKSLSSTAADFLVKSFAKTQLKLVVNSEQFKPAVQDAAKFVGDQFAKVKPQIQDFTQTAVKETTEAGLKVASVFASPAIKGSFQAFTAVGVPAAAGLAQALLPLALRAIAVYEASTWSAPRSGRRASRSRRWSRSPTRRRTQGLTAIPAAVRGRGPEAEGHVEELDGALANAFQASKEKSPIDLASGRSRTSRSTTPSWRCASSMLSWKRPKAKPCRAWCCFETPRRRMTRSRRS
jgi:hypothetical protein